MNKTDLVKEVAAVVQSRSEAKEAVDCLLSAIQQALEQGERVSITGFGSFTAETRAARKARNPMTGETIDLKERRVPKFVPGADLRKAVNGS